jgi:hypothetical protein
MIRTEIFRFELFVLAAFQGIQHTNTHPNPPYLLFPNSLADHINLLPPLAPCRTWQGRFANRGTKRYRREVPNPFSRQLRAWFLQVCSDVVSRPASLFRVCTRCIHSSLYKREEEPTDKMPNRLQWWRDRLTHDYALIGACIVAVLLAALIWLLWIAPDLAMYFATGLIRLAPVF